jgi:hypothetical protein
MIPPGSRYEVADRQATLSHSYSTRGFPLLSGDAGKTSLHTRTDLREALYRVTTEPDVLGATVTYYVKESENLPYLGFKILDDPNQWHVLAEMNPHIWYPLDIQPGDFLRLPVT